MPVSAARGLTDCSLNHKTLVARTSVSIHGRCKAAWKREFKLPWREAGPPNHHDDEVDSYQYVGNKEVSVSMKFPGETWRGFGRSG
jgi:hypothetical protein